MGIPTKKFQIGTDYARIMLSNLIKGGDLEETELRGFLGLGTKQANDFGKLDVNLNGTKFIKGGFNYVKKERTERFYID